LSLTSDIFGLLDFPRARLLPQSAERCPLLGVKQTLVGGAAMSAFDPKRTFAVQRRSLRTYQLRL